MTGGGMTEGESIYVYIKLEPSISVMNTTITVVLSLYYHCTTYYYHNVVHRR